MDLNSLIDGCQHFTWGEALYLPSWGTHHIPSDTEKANIIKIAQVMEKVRLLLNSPLNIHCWIRPVLNNPQSSYNCQDYNKYVGGALNSAHKVGLAVDFNPINITCSQGKAILLPQLQSLGMRMENNGDTANWIHLDLYPVQTSRYFVP